MCVDPCAAPRRKALTLVLVSVCLCLSQLAASLSKAFAGLSLDLNELSTNGTAGLGSEVPNLAKLLNMTLAPGERYDTHTHTHSHTHITDTHT